MKSATGLDSAAWTARPGRRRAGGEQAGLVGLDRQHVVRVFVPHEVLGGGCWVCRASAVTTTAAGVDPGQVDPGHLDIAHRGRGLGDLVGLGGDLTLREHHARAVLSLEDDDLRRR
ncbi:MAG: hypothetical protein ACYDDU_18275 [Dermatophilaceae bacterium]